MDQIHEDPDKLRELVLEQINKAENENVFKEEAIERIKRKKIGFFLRALNSIEFIANQFTRYKFNDMNLFDAVPVLKN